VQDFRMVCRAVLNDDPEAADHLRFVAFDLLHLAGEDLRSRPWTHRDRLLAEALPGCWCIRASTLTAGCGRLDWSPHLRDEAALLRTMWRIWSPPRGWRREGLA
jgi:hypothetical protein